MPHSSRREHLVDTAIRLFAEHGFHATGIDLILETAGVSKKTMYTHFRSKDELILAALKKYDGQFRNDFMRQVEASAKTPEARIKAVFDVAGAWFADKRFFGCTFINAVGEHSAPDTPVRRACQDFKAAMRGYIENLCREAGLKDPEGLAKKLALLLEGAIVTSQVSSDQTAAQTARETAKILIEAARG